MSASKEIRGKIKSVQHTSKITRAMEMVAASKMRKAQERMRRARPYAEHIRSVVARLASANEVHEHPYLRKDDLGEISTVGLIVVATDKGLCGALNTNLFRLVLGEIGKFQQKGLSVRAMAVGNKALGFLSRAPVSVVSQATHLGDDPRLEQLIGSMKVLLDAYEDKEIGSICLAFNRFESAMRQTPVVEQLLPILPASFLEGSPSHQWEYIYEPKRQEIIDHLLLRYVESLIYQSVIESGASEQSARMLAMKSASDNAKQVVDELRLSYNKARQASITQELSEIVSGSAALT